MTVHDLLEHMSRGQRKSGLRRSMHYQLTRRVLKGAARIFAVSQFSRAKIEKLFGIPSAKIDVVYNAIDERFLHGHASPAERQLIAERYLVTYPFLLYAAASALTRTWSALLRRSPRCAGNWRKSRNSRI